METKTYRFDQVTINHDKKRKPLSAQQRAGMQGEYRYYGAQSVIDHVNDYLFDGEYLLIAEDGENLKSGKQDIAQIVEGQFWLNNHAHIVQTNELCNLRYLCYLLNAMDISGFITGSAQPKLSQSNMNAILIELPDRVVQDKIVEILHSLDKKININNQINRNLSEQVQALYRHIFVDPGKVLKQCRAEEYFDIAIGKTPPRKEQEWFSENPGDVKWFSISDMGKCGTFISNCSEYLTREAVEKFNVAIVPEDTVLLSFKLTVGRIAITTCESTTNEAIAHFKHKDATINPYLYCYLRDFSFEELGSTSSIATAVNSKIIKGMPFIIPDEEGLKQFNEIAIPAFNQIKVCQAETRSLSELRDTLLPKLMSGELNVSVFDADF